MSAECKDASFLLITFIFLEAQLPVNSNHFVVIIYIFVVAASTMLFFPYFNEPQVAEFMPGLRMSDYKVNYSNHSGYRGGEGGKLRGSPARIYTDIPLNQLVLPKTQGYKYVLCVCQLLSFRDVWYSKLVFPLSFGASNVKYWSHLQFGVVCRWCRST